MQKVKVSGHSVQSLEWKRTNGDDYISYLANAVGKKNFPKRISSGCNLGLRIYYAMNKWQPIENSSISLIASVAASA